MKANPQLTEARIKVSHFNLAKLKTYFWDVMSSSESNFKVEILISGGMGFMRYIWNFANANHG